MNRNDHIVQPWQRMPRAYLIVVVLVFLALTSFSSALLQASSSITPEQAINFVGSFQTVCGKVVSTKYATEKRGAPTFLNLNRLYPDQVFTALI